MTRTALRSTFQSALAACALAIASPPSASAQVVETGVSDVVKVTLLPGWRDAEGQHIAALRFTLAPGWKTYWRTPGDGGVPTRFSLMESSDIHDVQILWPRPEVFRSNGLRSIGYRDQLVLPFAFEAATGGAIAVDGTLDFGVCEEICLPIHLDLSFLLPPERVSNVDEITAAMRQRPTPAKLAHVRRVTCKIAYYDNDNRARIDVEIDMPPLAGRNEALVIEATNADLWISEPVLARHGDILRATAQISARKGAPLRLDMDQLRMTVLTTAEAVDIKGCR